MKRLLIITLLLTTQLPASGIAYYESCVVAWRPLDFGKYRRGDEDWDKKNEEWVESDSDEPYPDDLDDIDGRGYEDSRDAGSRSK